MVKSINNKMTKIFKLFLIIFCFGFFAKPALAGFGISPADIYNDHLKPGSSFEKDIVLSRSEASEDLKIVIETDLKEAESWFEFEPGKEFIFPAGQSRYTLKIKVNISPQADIKTYQGIIRIKASSVDTKDSGVSIIKGARMEVNLVTTSLDVNTFIVRGMSISKVGVKDPIKLLMNIENNGNTKTALSKVTLEIQDLTQKTIETQEDTSLDKIDPNTSKEIIAEFKNNLGGGEYFGLVKVYLDDEIIHSDRLVFKVIGESAAVSQLGKASFITKFVDLIRANKVETIAILLIPLFPIIIGLVIYKFGFLLSIKSMFLGGTIVYTIIAFALLSLYHFMWKPANMAQPSDVGSVQGESIESSNVATPIPPKSNPPLKVDRKQIDGYPIYRTPDFDSIVVYVAKENEKFQVIDEKNDWYQVLTSNGNGGWLHQNSIKQSN